jgi:hypothetical protein
MISQSFLQNGRVDAEWATIREIILSSRTITPISDFNLSKDVVNFAASGLHHNLSEVHGEAL